MEIQTSSLETILASLQKYATECKTSLIVDARIAVSPHETRLIAMQPERPLEIIRY